MRRMQSLKELGLLRPEAGKPKILVFDIETAPYLIAAWGTFKTNALDIIQEWFMLSFAYGWYDIDEQAMLEVEVIAQPQFKGYRKDRTNDVHVARRLWALFDEADIIVGVNSERFDVRKANERFLVHGFAPPAPSKQLDIQRHYRRMFSGPAGLKYMARRTDVTQKMSNSGLSLWFRCMDGDEDAWAEMMEYNEVDVWATAETYTALLPWLGELGKPAVPNVSHYMDVEPDELVCPVCGNRDREYGGEGFQRRGYYETAAYRYPRFRCNRCGSYRKSYKSTPGTRTQLR